MEDKVLTSWVISQLTLLDALLSIQPYLQGQQMQYRDLPEHNVS